VRAKPNKQTNREAPAKKTKRREKKKYQPPHAEQDFLPFALLLYFPIFPILYCCLTVLHFNPQFFSASY